MKDAKPLKLAIIAGEESGDLLGADLVMALREKLPKLTPFGVTGQAMNLAGVEGIADIETFSVMGITDIAGRLAELRMLETRLLAWIERLAPRFAVLIDNPYFHLRFAEQLKMRGVPVYQYVAPKIWAWGEKRAPKLREHLDMVLGILPFEEAFFKERGINYTYVGSPLKDRIDKVIIRREALGLKASTPVIACLPGSRPSELRLNLPTILGVRRLIAQALPGAEFIVPVADNLGIEDVATVIRDLGGGDVTPEPAGAEGGIAAQSWRAGGLRFVRGMSLELMAAADAAIVASGTATLECALLGTPHVVVYTMSELSYRMAKRAVKLPYVSLTNLVAGRKIVEEYIQEFDLSAVAADLLSLLTDEVRRKALRESFQDMREKLVGTAAANAATLIATRVESGPQAAAGG